MRDAPRPGPYEPVLPPEFAGAAAFGVAACGRDLAALTATWAARLAVRAGGRAVRAEIDGDLDGLALRGRSCSDIGVVLISHCQGKLC